MKTEQLTGADGAVTFRPPSCPECSNPLYRVNRVKLNFTIMDFSVSRGAFAEGLRHDDYHGRMVCPHCGHFLGVCKPDNGEGDKP